MRSAGLYGNGNGYNVDDGDDDEKRRKRRGIWSTMITMMTLAVKESGDMVDDKINR